MKKTIVCAWAGGAFGPKAGTIGLMAMILRTILIAGWVRWRYGRIQIHTQLTKPDLITQKQAKIESNQ